MIMYETITTEETIIDQINRFLKNNFNLEFDAKKPGSTKINTAIKKRAGIIFSNSIFSYSRNF